MARTVSLLGQNYSVPEPSDTGYDTALTNYLVALATAFPQLNGTNSALTAEMDFGASFGLKSIYYKSRTANPAAAGQVRLAGGDSVSWRNAANAADVALAKDSADQLTWGGLYVTGNPLLIANTAAGQSIPNNANTAVVFGAVELDTDSAYNSGSGLFTVPTGKGGHYQVCAEICFNAAITGTVAVGIRVGGVAKKEAQFINTAAKQTLLVAADFSLSAGNTVDVYAFQNSGAGVVLESLALHNYTAIKRITT